MHRRGLGVQRTAGWRGGTDGACEKVGGGTDTARMGVHRMMHMVLLRLIFITYY